MAGIEITHIPYKTLAEQVTDLMSGQVQVMFGDWGLLSPHAKAGKVRIIAAASAEPSPLAPGLTTVASAGLPGFASVAMTGLFAPAKTPDSVVRRLNQEAVRYLTRPETKQTFLNMASEVVANSPEQFATTIKSEVAIWGKVIKAAGIKPD
jgi:tripartite-type tricarboxylate transporter receptor subunit TctC